ncbi:MAG: arsenosugar biosynthesis radical SAM (seleno)protein ArsS [Acidobacteriota bacterium]
MISFEEKLAEQGINELRAAQITTLQVNVGKKCNQACKHCHVDAGPHRTEEMTRETVDQVLAAIRTTGIKTIDITGGAPELNVNFEYLVREAKQLGCHVMVRCNLTVLLLPDKLHLPEFYRDHKVEVISSLPYFLADRTDAQRGIGVFDRSLEAIQRLNDLGYGKEGTGLLLHLVYNPVGAYLPPSQQELERDFKRELWQRYQLVFNSLYTITNMPIKRYLEYLHRSGNYERYMEKLISSFNPTIVSGLMCRNLVSISWDGKLYDCDFNQMLEMTVHPSAGRTIADFNVELMAGRPIQTGLHCFGCTAGTGSSCGGSLVNT